MRRCRRRARRAPTGASCATSRARSRRTTHSLEAYDLFHKGRALQNRRGRFILDAIRCFEQAIAIRLIEIAVRYRRAGREYAQTLDFTITDRNTSSLLSVEDPFERVLGHRLLRHWNILREGRAPGDEEGMAVLPALLAIWDIGADKVTGAWLLDRGVDPGLLTELGEDGTLAKSARRGDRRHIEQFRQSYRPGSVGHWLPNG